MRGKLTFILAGAGLLIAIVSIPVFNQTPHAQPPAFNPAPNPYHAGIYAEGIVESAQSNGQNINIYPEVAGPILRVLADEGAQVKAGDPLVTIDDSIQRQITAQQQAQIEVTRAQIANAEATTRMATDRLAKQERAFAADPQSVSIEVLDSTRNNVKIAKTNLQVYERQYTAQVRATAAAEALLAKYTLRAPRDGVILALQAAEGSYVSAQGAYDSYSQSMVPLIIMGSSQDHLEVRTYVDEILVHRLPRSTQLRAQMYLRGTQIHIPVTFARLQPMISPKIQLSNQRRERVDVRVLPLIFRFDKSPDVVVYPGQLVDVYISDEPL